MSTVYVLRRPRKGGYSYAVRYADPCTGQKRHYGTYRKKREADRVANELRSILDSGQMPIRKETRFSPMTFNEIADCLDGVWKERILEGSLQEGTVYDYRIWLNAWRDVFGSKLLAQITTNDIVAVRIEIAQNTSTLNANKHLSILKQVIKLGIELKAILRDPSEPIKKLNEKKHVRNRFLLPEELSSLIAASRKTRAKFYLPAIIYLAAEHGAAKQEVLDLEWSDIHFDYGDQGIVRFYRTKNQRERTHALMPRARQALLVWKSHLEKVRHRRRIHKVETNRVFCRANGRPLSGFQNSWRSALKLAGISDFHFHDLRHTYCSNLLLSGSNLKEVKDMIGHNDIAMTNRYTHLTDAHRSRAGERLSSHYMAEGGEGNWYHIGTKIADPDRIES